MTFFIESMRRNLLSVVIAIGLGVLLCMMQNSFGGNSSHALKVMKVAIIDEEQSALSKGLIHYLQDDIKIEIQTGESYEVYSRALLNRDLSAIININKNFQENMLKSDQISPIEITTINDYANEAFLKAYVDGYMKQVEVILPLAQGEKSNLENLLKNIQGKESTFEVIGASEQMVKQYASERGFELAQGFYLNMIYYIGLFIGLMIVTDRLGGVFNRIQSTPIKPMDYILGTSLYGLVIGGISTAIYITYLKINHIEVGLSLWLVAYLLLIFVVIVLGTSITLAFLVNTKIGAVFTIYGVGCITAILGGAYFETNMAPEFLERLAKIVPQYWFMDCIRGVQSGTSYNPLGAIVILGLFALLFMLLGIVLFNKQVVTKE